MEERRFLGLEVRPGALARAAGLVEATGARDDAFVGFAVGFARAA